MKNFINLILFMAVMVCLPGCADKLDIPQQGVVSVDNFYSTDLDAEEAVAALYNQWRVAVTTAFQFKNLLADELYVGGAFRTDNTDLQNVSESVLTASNSSYLTNYFSQLYATVYRANLIINHFDGGDSSIKDRVIAEAHFFRAYAYFELVTLWGGMPIVTAELAPSEYKQPNSDPADIWALVEADLRYAIEIGSLPSKNSVDDKITTIRVTRETALAYLGKAYLYQKKYDSAKTAFMEVVQSNRYALEDDFGIFYHIEGDNSKEYLLECNRHFDQANLFAQGGWLGILVNWHFGNKILSGPATHTFYDFMNYQGYGFFVPYKSLYDTFVSEEGENGYRLGLTIKTWQELKDMGITTIGTQSFYGNEGYWRFKWLPKQSEEHVATWGGNYSNTPVMRYADVLLMMAETCVNTGDATGATYLNMVRERAGLSHKASITMDDVKLERKLELAMEGVRFQDLIRWGDAAQVLANKGKQLPTFRIAQDGTTTLEYATNENSLAGFTVGRDELMPVPQDELNVNDLIQQNIGY